MKRTYKVCVIGAGISGLPTAVNIIEKNPNVEVTIISEKFSPNTTGDGAAGLWQPYLPGATPIQLVKRWGKSTWDHLTGLMHTELGPQIGIQMVPVYNLYQEPQEDPFWTDIVFGFRKVPRDEIKRVFSTDSEYTFGHAYTSVVTECNKYLPWLMKRFQRQGGKVEHRRVNSIGELAASYDVVVNCTGVGAYHLVNDKEVTPIKGQIIKVLAPGHMIMASLLGDGPLVHATPLSDYVVLGGTTDRGRWDTDIDPKDGLDVYTRCLKMFPSLKNAKVIGEWSGLRPGRTSIRVEREEMKFGPHTVPVVHNYGHGGCGITLHWGCAEHAAELVQQCLQDKSQIPSKL